MSVGNLLLMQLPFLFFLNVYILKINQDSISLKKQLNLKHERDFFQMESWQYCTVLNVLCL